MSDDRSIQYWDTPIFINLLTNKDSDIVETVLALISDVEARPARIRVAISWFVRAEVLPLESYEPEHVEIVERLFRVARREFLVYTVTREIAELARQMALQEPSLTVPDAIHVATAVFAGADVMYTYDGLRDNKRNRSGGLLGLNGKIGNPPLRIEPPTRYKGYPLLEGKDLPPPST